MHIIYGSAKVRLYRRKDGRWSINWTEGGKKKSNTFNGTEKAANDAARKVAIRLENSRDGVTITYEESEYLKRLQAIASRLKKKPHQLLDKIEEDNPNQSNDLFADLLTSMENQYLSDKSKSPETWKSLHDEFKAFKKKYPDMMIRDITIPLLLSWCDRNKPGEQTFNNRVTIWRTFYNKARARKEYKPLQSPANEIEKKKLPTKIPPVFTVKQLRNILSFLHQDTHKHNHSNHLAAFCIAVWAGLRPTEIQRLNWTNIDLKKNYIHADITICRKLRHERYIPIHPCLKEILTTLKPTDPDRIITANGWRNMIKRIKDARPKDKKIIPKWAEDITRHSYISYRIAVTKNIAQVADECGNSEQIIKTRYRKPIPPKQGEKWFKSRFKR